MKNRSLVTGCLLLLLVVLIAPVSSAQWIADSIYERVDDIIRFEDSGITQFNQAPMLDELVASGQLPPVEERLPKNPVVLVPEEEIGQYGGYLRSTDFNPTNLGITGHILFEAPYAFNRFEDELVMIPNIIEDWNWSEDGKTLVWKIREGIRWSDGVLVTVDDFLFWYEDVMLNPDISPVVAHWVRPGGENMKVTKIDDFTLQLDFAAPFFYWDEFHNSYWYRGGDTFLPKHYLMQYHADYNPDAEKIALEAGYQDWVDYFDYKAARHFTQPKPIGRPTLSAWDLVEESPTGMVFRRNPYYWKVDTAGNQLPYIDEIRTTFIPDGQTRNLRALAGDIDFLSSFLSISDYPTFVRNQESGGYDAWIGTSGWSNSVLLVFQHNYDQFDPVLAEIVREPNFRKALSLAIDRDEINEVVYLGQGQPRQFTYAPHNVPYYDEAWERSYAEYDPERAKQMLDDLGLVDTDGDGWRNRPDGEILMLNLSSNSSREENVATCELVTEYWESIGVRVNMRAVDETTFFPRLDNGQDPVAAVFITDDRPPTAAHYSPVIQSHLAWRTWLDRYDYMKGELRVPEEELPELAEKPPQEIIDWFVMDMMMQHISEEDRIPSIKTIGDYIAETIPHIGTVGLVGHVGISNKDLGNVRRVGDNPGVAATRNAYLEQAYWKTPERRGEK